MNPGINPGVLFIPGNDFADQLKNKAYKQSRTTQYNQTQKTDNELSKHICITFLFIFIYRDIQNGIVERSTKKLIEYCNGFIAVTRFYWNPFLVRSIKTGVRPKEFDKEYHSIMERGSAEHSP